MAGIEAKFQQNPPLGTHKLFLGAHICLRILTVTATLTAAWMMITSKQTVEVYGIQVEAKYSYSSAFKFFSYANAIACGCSVLTLFPAFSLFYRGSTPMKFFLLFLHDLCMMSLVLAGCAAATAIGYVGRYGNNHAGWMAICDQFDEYCNRIRLSLMFSYLAFVFILMLTIMSANKSREIRVWE
ncbi:CASP-like protein 1F1 [Vitis riparia]|uniref:CASP-like protein 1F1 n=1 Tax=Vitis riparia TaxID=96939 RepID=UPI00155B19CB|nr:CASP-like protein 1F1 [Vitis riparia]